MGKGARFHDPDKRFGPREVNMTEEQRAALKRLCESYHVEYRDEDYLPAFDLPPGYVAGWIGGNEHNGTRAGFKTLYVGCSPEGEISS